MKTIPHLNIQTHWLLILFLIKELYKLVLEGKKTLNFFNYNLNKKIITVRCHG